MSYKRRHGSRLASAAFWILMVLFCAGVSCVFFSLSAIAETRLPETDPPKEYPIIKVSQAITKLQPTVEPARALRLAATFIEAAWENDHDPLLLVAMTMRESSFDPLVETLERRGKLGEGGLMQIHGAALNLRPKRCSKDLPSAYCQIHTGARWLWWVRDHCGGSTSRWVAAYGMSKCPSEKTAPLLRSVRMVKAYYDRVGGAAWD